MPIYRRPLPAERLMPPRNLRSLQRMEKGSPVVVSFVGETGFGAPHVYADSGQRCDWSALEPFHPLIVARPGIDWVHAGRMLFEQQAHAGSYPLFIDIERQQIASVIWAWPLKLWQVKRGTEPWLAHFG